MNLLHLKVPHWQEEKGLLHGFLGRCGGTSTGPFASLNLSFRVGDDPRAVKDNFCDMKKAVGVHDARIVTMKQVHGDHIVEVRDDQLKEAGEADGMITDQPGIFLGVLTADCVPLLFAVRGQKLVAAVHAGWRGTLAGISVKLLERLAQGYGVAPGSVEVALGPAIGGCCYEIGDDVARPLVERWGSAAESSLKKSGTKHLLELRKLNRSILIHAGIPPEQIHEVGPCTSCESDKFFSYRREQKETGRQISFIGWVPPHEP